MVEIMDETKAIAQSVRDDADEGLFNGPPGPPGPSGEGEVPDLSAYVKTDDRDNFVKEGITETEETWTDEEKASACETIGAVLVDTSTTTNKAPLVYTNDKARKHYLASNIYDYKAYNVPMIYGATGGELQVGGYLLTNTPNNPYHCANKKYVDNLPDYLTLTDEQKAKWKTWLENILN
jgi:hypothetical protein